MFKLFIDAHALHAPDASHVPYVSAKNHLNKPLPKSPLLNNRYCCFFRKMSTNISTDSLDGYASRTSPTSPTSLTKYAEDPSLDESIAFKEWLAGLIDGDGSFSVPKNGKPRFEITIDGRDKKVLYLIKHKYNGSIKEISKGHAFKYKLKNKKSLILLIKDINGLIRNPTRLLQMSKLCKLYNIDLKNYKGLRFNNGWFSGFLDSDGSIHLDNKSKILHIGITQKNKYLLDPLVNLYGGRVRVSGHKGEAFEYVIYRKNELFKLIDDYFNKYPLRTAKMQRINLIKNYFLMKLNEKNLGLAERVSEEGKWLDKWQRFKD